MPPSVNVWLGRLLELAAASPGTGEPDGELAVQITQQDCRWHGPGGRGTGAASASGERGRAHCALGGRRLGGNRRAEESWQAHHSGMVISGLLRVEMDNGSILEVGPNDVYDVPPAPPGTAGGW